MKWWNTCSGPYIFVTNFDGEPRHEHERSHFDSPLADVAFPSPGSSPALLFHCQGDRICRDRENARADVVELSCFKPDAGRGDVSGQPAFDPRRGLLAASGPAALDLGCG